MAWWFTLCVFLHVIYIINMDILCRYLEQNAPVENSESAVWKSVIMRVCGLYPLRAVIVNQQKSLKNYKPTNKMPCLKTSLQRRNGHVRIQLVADDSLIGSGSVWGEAWYIFQFQKINLDSSIETIFQSALFVVISNSCKLNMCRDWACQYSSCFVPFKFMFDFIAQGWI